MSRFETEGICQQYERRKTTVEKNRYSFLNPDVWQSNQERQRIMLRLFRKLGWTSFENTKLVEVGCGSGGNLLEFLRIGFQPDHLFGLELLEDRLFQAQKVLPKKILRLGNAMDYDVEIASWHIVYQSVVFSSILDVDFQQALAHKMWTWVKPGGGVLWYDFIYNNPSNPDVRGMPVSCVRKLFPEGKMNFRRITLAPPISRRICKWHPSLYTLFNLFPFLRTHVLCWIGKI